MRWLHAYLNNPSFIDSTEGTVLFRRKEQSSDRKGGVCLGKEMRREKRIEQREKKGSRCTTSEYY